MHRTEPSRSEQAEAISAEIGSIHWKAQELGVGVADTVVGDDFVAVVWRFDLIPAEQVVIAAGHRNTVLSFHQSSELTIEYALRAAVERATGRTVAAFQTETDLDEGVALELFVLAPAATSGGDPRG